MTAQHDRPTDETREWAALYALDALPTEDKAAFEKHLREGCASCAAEVESYKGVAGQVGFAAAPEPPPASLRERVLQAVAQTDSAAEEEPEQRADAAKGILFDQGGVLISRTADMDWEAAPLPGIFAKTLFNDPKRQYSTSLVRMEAGVTYPSHRHKEVEELYLLEGDLLVEGRRMQPGDYCRGEPESVHGQVSTEAGAVFLVMASQRDEILN